MENQQVVLQAEKDIDIRFSEVDAMQIVWHGSYALYFEDAREEFGRKYKLEYMRMYEFGFYAPLVELKFNYKRPLKYQDKARIKITFRNNRLVRQEAVLYVARRQHDGRHKRLVANVDVVVLLEALLESAKNRDSVLLCRRIDHNRLEAALERGVLLHVLAVLVESRRSDAVELAARKHGL